jgi:hypothetical protein
LDYLTNTIKLINHPVIIIKNDEGKFTLHATNDLGRYNFNLEEVLDLFRSKKDSNKPCLLKIVKDKPQEKSIISIPLFGQESSHLFFIIGLDLSQHTLTEKNLPEIWHEFNNPLAILSMTLGRMRNAHNLDQSKIDKLFEKQKVISRRIEEAIINVISKK